MPERSLPPGSRGIRLGAAPTRSVVVASSRPRASLDAALDALLPQCAARGIEVVLCRASATDEIRSLAAAYPSVVLMPAPDGTDARGLRAIGLTAADGDIVTILDDAAPVAPDWAARCLDARAAADA